MTRQSSSSSSPDEHRRLRSTLKEKKRNIEINDAFEKLQRLVLISFFLSFFKGFIKFTLREEKYSFESKKMGETGRDALSFANLLKVGSSKNFWISNNNPAICLQAAASCAGFNSSAKDKDTPTGSEVYRASQYNFERRQTGNCTRFLVREFSGIENFLVFHTGILEELSICQVLHKVWLFLTSQTTPNESTASTSGTIVTVHICFTVLHMVLAKR